MDGRQEQIRAAVARAICAACGEEPERPGDARGNAFRWQDYEQTAEAVVFELQAAEAGETGRSAVPHLASATLSIGAPAASRSMSKVACGRLSRVASAMAR